MRVQQWVMWGAWVLGAGVWLGCGRAQVTESAGETPAEDSLRRTQAWLAQQAAQPAPAALDTAVVLDVLGPLSGLRVLEVGAGAGHWTERLLRAGADSLLAWEPDSAARALLVQRSLPPSQQPRLQVQGGPWEAMQPLFPQGAGYDLIWVHDALPRLGSPVATLRALLPMLAPQGRLVLLEARAGCAGAVPGRPVQVAEVLTHLRGAGYRHFAMDTTALPCHLLLVAR